MGDHAIVHAHLGRREILAQPALRRRRSSALRNNEPMALEFSRRIAQIPVYPAAESYGDGKALVRLASNESPYPPLPAVKDAIARALEGLNRYPDPTNSALRRRLSERYGVPPSRIAIGNGSCDILLAAADALLEPGAEIVYAWPSFSVYPHLSATSGASAVTVPLDREERHDLDGMLREITVATRLVVVCNPNNPTSTALPVEEIARFVVQVPDHVWVIVDEAYCEFNVLDDPEASVQLLAAHPNLALLRTFSKVYGLCGLRVGFALCGSEGLVRALDQVRQPFFCNALAQAAALEALAHQDAVEDRVTRTIAERISVDERLRALGIAPADSQANFCWFSLPEGVQESDVMSGLAERGILVRAGSALGREGALRVTYGTTNENARFLDSLEDVLAASRS
jgi:histidinol-phosphate aminotransferase